MIRAWSMLLTVAIFGGCAPQQTSGAVLPAADPVAYAPLAPFYESLRRLQAGERPRLAVLQIGDSHSANDSFSGRLRELMQARFGDGGRGMLPPGVPYRYYRPAKVSVTATGWQPRRGLGDGFAGLRQQARAPSVMTIEADPGELTRVSIEALAQPGGGTVEITTSDGTVHRTSTEAATPSIMRIKVATTPATSSVEVKAGRGAPVDLLSWTVERAGRGLTWSNLGTIGATVEVMQGWDRTILASEAAALQPALVMIAFGTNEGFKDSTDLAAYPALFRAAIRMVRQAAPSAAIIVAGPPGGVRANGAGQGEACPGEAGLAWTVPVNLPKIRAIERRIAGEERAFFWDWSAAMGGDCAIVPWAETDPPLAARDHVHLLKPGYQQTAAALFDTLMRGYALYGHMGMAE